MTVAVVSAIYGTGYDEWAGPWMAAISNLRRQPDDVLLHRGFPHAGEKWPHARLLNEAIDRTKADWIWVLNVDDVALPGGLDGIDDVEADVWMVGYAREHAPDYIPGPTTREAILGDTNLIPSMSPFRRIRWDQAGGYPLIGHEDWGLWRRMARNGCTFEPSGRAHCMYRTHDLQRHVIETDRAAMLAEIRADTLSG